MIVKVTAAYMFVKGRYSRGHKVTKSTLANTIKIARLAITLTGWVCVEIIHNVGKDFKDFSVNLSVQCKELSFSFFRVVNSKDVLIKIFFMIKYRTTIVAQDLMLGLELFGSKSWIIKSFPT